jgi:phosphonate degradation associated HDIG domain protein
MNMQITDDIIEMYETYGKEDYDGEPVSQASHMIQCAMLGIQEHADDELVLAAFLHDIGHLLGHLLDAEAMDGFGTVNHENIGAAYLKQAGFSNRICAVVEHHVNAKRYLVATNETYSKKLSEASWRTLQWQGGPMTSNEIEIFKDHRYFDDIIMVRLWDEQAKDTTAEILDIAFFSNLIQQHLASAKHEDIISSI